MRPKALGMFVLLAALAMVSPAFAQQPRAADQGGRVAPGSHAMPKATAPVPDSDTTPHATAPGEPMPALPDNDQAQTPDRLQGKVVAVDPEHGRLLLATDAGMIALKGDPDEVANLKPGDMIEVVMIDEGSPSSQPSALPDFGGDRT